jgi:polar amino acid transport system substrate-binding protein
VKAHRRIRGDVLVGFGAALLLAVVAAEATPLTGRRVCADPDNLPFSRKDPAPHGFEIELARALIADVTFRWLPTYRWPVVRRELLDRRCDLFFGLPLDPRFTDENRRLALSRPYYVVGQVLVSGAAAGIRRLEDIQGKVIGVETATAGDILVTRLGGDRRIYATPAETFEALRARQVDAAVMASPQAGWLARTFPGFALHEVRDPEGEFEIAIGMRREDGDLKAAVDAALERLLASGTVGEILGRYGVPRLATQRAR